jgi:hypothetical protein
MAVADPVAAFYGALRAPWLDEYPTEPLGPAQLRRWPPVSHLLLAEWAGLFCDATGGQSETTERVVWRLTRRLRGEPHPTIGPLAAFLLHLLEIERDNDTAFDFILARRACVAIRPLKHGTEVAGTVEAALDGLAAADLTAVAQCGEVLALAGLDDADLLRPEVVQAARALADVAAEIGLYFYVTSPAERAGALNRAVGLLDELSHYVAAITLPERVLLARVVQRWQGMVAEAAGRLGEQALREAAPAALRISGVGKRRSTLWSRPATPYPNPYVTGRPVDPPLFVGRQDILGRIRSVWRERAQPDSIILYGHRRMGKTSILRNLGANAPAGSVLVNVDLKGEMAFGGAADLFLNLAEAVRHAADDPRRRSLGGADDAGTDLDGAAYDADAGAADADLDNQRRLKTGAGADTPADAARALHRLLRQVAASLPEGGSLILALDEFEAIDVAVAEGRIEHSIYDFLRMLAHEPRTVLVLAGLHTLDEMSRSYREAFFSGYVNIAISYLDEAAATQLITRPTAEFSLSFHADVIARIFAETHGQPLLIQRICQELVNHVNYELFDLERARAARILPADLDAVLSDEFVLSESRYFEGLWQDQIVDKAELVAVLEALGRADGPRTAVDLAAASGLVEAEVQTALKQLEVRDLVRPVDGAGWDILIPLLRRWLRLRARGL